MYGVEVELHAFQSMELVAKSAQKRQDWISSGATTGLESVNTKRGAAIQSMPYVECVSDNEDVWGLGYISTHS